MTDHTKEVPPTGAEGTDEDLATGSSAPTLTRELAEQEVPACGFMYLGLDYKMRACGRPLGHDGSLHYAEPIGMDARPMRVCAGCAGVTLPMRRCDDCGASYHESCLRLCEYCDALTCPIGCHRCPGMREA